MSDTARLLAISRLISASNEPMVPPAPALFSTTMVCPNRCEPGSSTIGPSKSMVLPGVKRTMARIGFFRGEARTQQRRHRQRRDGSFRNRLRLLVS